MRRAAATTLAFVTLAGLAGGQGPAVMPVGDQLRLLRADRAVLDQLVDHGLRLADTGTPVGRADQCQKAARTLAVATRRAAADAEADRVTEFGGHLERVVREAVLPALADAAAVIPAESPDAAKLRDTQTRAALDLTEVRDALPSGTAVGDAPGVPALRTALQVLLDRLK